MKWWLVMDCKRFYRLRPWVLSVCVIFMAAFLCERTARALPFNDDMVHSKNNKGGHLYYKTGEMMRAKPEGSVAVGASSYMVSSFDAAYALTNPTPGDRDSAIVGRRLFQVNCLPCHGDISAKEYSKGPVASKLLKVPPNISGAEFWPDQKRASGQMATDGYIYGVIHFGLGLMPPLGWKLSPQEHWDIINYLREVQRSKAGAK